MLLAVITTLLALSAVHCRDLKSITRSASDCQPRWSAQLDLLLANTPSSGNQGKASISLIDEETLYIRVETPEGSRIKGLTLRHSNSLSGGLPLGLPLSTQMQHIVEYSLDVNTTAFTEALELLDTGKTSVIVEVAADKHTRLVGALRDECHPSATESQSITWSKGGKGLPACNVPGFSELYMIPNSCTNFAHRVEQNCKLSVDDILVASAHTAEGEHVTSALSTAACLPKGCDPCAVSLGNGELVETVWAYELEAEASSCKQPGFEGFYSVPVMCDNLADRLQDFCGVSMQDVLQASAQSLGLLLDGICIPNGCDPCAAYPEETATVTAALQEAPPFCENSYMFRKAYSIPSGCGNFQEALERQCGVHLEAVAEASAIAAFPQYSGFGEGKTVCLPDFCEPCELVSTVAAIEVS